MEKFNAPLSFKVIYILNEIIFWLFSGIAVVAVVFAVLASANVFKDDMQLHVNLPVAFSNEEIGYINAYNVPGEVQLVEAYGKIHFINTPLKIIRPYMAAMVLVMGMIFSLLFIFRKFIRNMRKGIIFDIDNIKLLRVLAFGMLIFWMLWRTYDWVTGMMLEKRLHFGTIDISLETQSHNVLLISSLILWVLSHIFIRGMKLQEDTSLTI